jgi:hypothetical protein
VVAALALSAFIPVLSVAVTSSITLAPHHERLAAISAQVGILRLARNPITDSLNKVRPFLSISYELQTAIPSFLGHFPML